ncbi:50S ribosomal protein L35 [bacterium]|nr:50S ribosomal protein L35 [bacterium]
MPKQKTHKGLAARVRVTRTGKVVRRRPGRRHLMSAKSGKAKSQLARPALVPGEYAKTVKRSLAGH